MKRQRLPESVSPGSETVPRAGDVESMLREELARAREALAVSQGEAQRLQHEIAEVRGAVRHAISVEIHDDLGQLLTGVAFLAQTILNDAPSALTQRATRLLALANECALRAHRIAEGLAAEPLPPRSLAVHLRELARSASQTFGVECVCVVAEGFPDPDPEAVSHLHSIAREAVVNAVRHSNGRRLSIELVDDGGFRTLTVRDDGAGFRPGASSSGLGLRNMQRRAALLGGSLQIEALPGGGSAVRCVW